MTDASPWGGALVDAPADAAELREEASWASRTGWLVTQLLRPVAEAEGPEPPLPSFLVSRLGAP
eukprot:8824986-Alexandrium_andersonii.AAC.1